MGRATKVSNPAEVTSSWVPDGDDGAGIYYTQQTYDWKGRPRVTTNPDGTTKEISYAGCGCAGGEVATYLDEGTVVDVAKKRQQKVYADVFGRIVKTEVMNWNGNGPNGTGGTIYTTTVKSYNARGQITAIKQYAGTEASSSLQESTLNYDGYGRLSKRHVPEQDAGKFTTWTYYADDTVQTITDARGATATHSYNNRHLLTGITYSAPAGITSTAAATFGYDAAGNKTSMTDGLGSKSYTYDQLSQLRSETRVLTGVGTFTLSYDYNLRTHLKKITDASNTTINYNYNVAGQLSGVTGSDTLVANVSTYASGIQYRAFGGLKQLSVGTLSTSFGYNARMQVMNFNISGVANENYDYYDDGRLKFVHNTTDNKFDRIFFYDHVGRMTNAFAGGAARSDLGDTPFSQDFIYNSFGDLAQRDTEEWGNGFFSDSGTFVNHRRVGWGYDASGRITTIDTRTYTYDAAGRNITLSGQQLTATGTISSLTESGFDGESNRVRENSGSNGSMTLKYYLTSSVLGNAVIEELNSSGQKQIGYVYIPGGTLLATQTIGTNLVKFIQASPHNVSERGAFTNGSNARSEFDAVGAKVRLVNLTPRNRAGDPGNIPMGGLGSLDTRYGALENPGAGCMLDGVYMPCYMAMRGVGTASTVDYVDPFFAANRGRFMRQQWVEEDTSTAVRTGDENILTIYSGPGGHFEYVDDPDDVLETYIQQKGQIQNPQNPQPPTRLKQEHYNKLKGVMGKALESKKCRDFIDKLISFNTGTTYNSEKNFLTHADNLYKSAEGGIFFKLSGLSGVTRKRAEDYHRVSIYTGSDVNEYPQVLTLNLEQFGETLMHELIHTLTKGSDDQLDQNLRALGITPTRKDGTVLPYPTVATGEGNGKDVIDFSTYWDTALKNACFPTL
jgi:YD repeat-containing protein